MNDSGFDSPTTNENAYCLTTTRFSPILRDGLTNILNTTVVLMMSVSPTCETFSGWFLSENDAGFDSLITTEVIHISFVRNACQ